MSIALGGGISSEDIDNWNSKTDNKGTVTTVKVGDSSYSDTNGVVSLPAYPTKSDLALNNVTNDAQVKRSEMGVANGVATLDTNGKVPSSQLPSYVDDVLEYSAKANFPSTGETGKIYVDTATNLTYRWSGSAYVEISPSIALGETSSTAFAGDKGKAAYAHAVTNKGAAFSSGLYKITTNSEGHVTAATAVTKTDITNLGIPASDTHQAVSSANNTATWGGTVTVGKVGSTDLKFTMPANPNSNTTYKFTIGSTTKGDSNGVDLGTLKSETAASNGTTLSLVTTGEKAIWNAKTSNTGTVTSVATGSGLTGGTITGSGTIKANLKSENKFGYDTTAIAANGGTSGRVYPVQLDKSGYLAVNVPWIDTTYSFSNKAATLAWNTTSTIATVGGVDITVKLPANPNTDTNTWKAANASQEGYVPKSTANKILRADGNGALYWGDDANTNTWRGIQDNLTSSTNTTESLSAKQGYLLANGSARDSTKLPLSGGTMTGTILFQDLGGTDGRTLIQQKMANNDFFRIYCGGTAENAGYVEIATADDSNEPIYVRQYNSGAFTSPTRTAALLDGNGNTSFPGTLTANAIKKSGGTSSQFLKADGSVDSNSYITGITKTMVTNALGYTPPTSDTNTTYSAGTGLSLSGTTFNVSYGTAAGTACQGNDSRLSDSRNAKDVYSWAKASSKPTYIASEVCTITSQAITSSVSFSHPLRSLAQSGQELLIVYTNSTSNDLTVTIPTTCKTPTGKALAITCPAGGYCEVNAINIGGTIYARGA